MNGSIDVCALCLQRRRLCDSHLICAGILRLLRDDRFKNPNPYVMSVDYIGQSSAQAKQYLLCNECEQRFSLNGEKWVSVNCYHERRQAFRLRKLLEPARPLVSGQQGAAYNASEIAGIDIEKLVYFGASVIWRASLRPWRVQKQDYRQTEIDPKCKEDLRLYLVGAAQFPRNAVSSVYISGSGAPLPLVIFPESLKDGSTWIHRFYIPGIWFHLRLGEGIGGDDRNWCILRSPYHPICFDQRGDALAAEIPYRLYVNEAK